MTLTVSGCSNSEVETSDRIVVTGDDFSVTRDMLVAATFVRRTGRDDLYNDLNWLFQEETFLIKAGENGLPPVLAGLLLT